MELLSISMDKTNSTYKICSNSKIYCIPESSYQITHTFSIILLNLIPKPQGYSEITNRNQNPRMINQTL